MADQNGFETLAGFIEGCRAFEVAAQEWIALSTNGHDPAEVRAAHSALEQTKARLVSANLAWKSPRDWRKVDSPDHDEGTQRQKYEQALDRNMGDLLRAFRTFSSRYPLT